MIADLIVITIIVLLLIFLVIRFISNRKKNKDKPYSSSCGSCQMANKCLKLKNKDNHNKD